MEWSWWVTSNIACEPGEQYSWLCLLTVTTRVISSVDLYCCLLPRCEALRTCRLGFPIATIRRSLLHCYIAQPQTQARHNIRIYSRWGQKTERGAKNQKGGHYLIKKIKKKCSMSIGCMQCRCSNRWAKREMGRHRFHMWGPGTTGPPTGDGPAEVV